MLTNQSLHTLITEHFTTYKVVKSPREHRIKVSNDLTEEYFLQHGEFPAATVLDRLATLILQDELADTHPDKMTRNEYPLLSDRQRDTRERGERSMMAAQDVATDRRDYRVNTRDSNRRMREVFG